VKCDRSLPYPRLDIILNHIIPASHGWISSWTIFFQPPTTERRPEPYSSSYTRLDIILSHILLATRDWTSSWAIFFQPLMAGYHPQPYFSSHPRLIIILSHILLVTHDWTSSWSIFHRPPTTVIIQSQSIPSHHVCFFKVYSNIIFPPTPTSP